MKTKIFLPLPPSQNHAYMLIPIKGGCRRRLTKVGEAWINEARWIFKASYPGFKPLDKVKLTYRFRWPDNRMRDDDNYQKLMRDALEGFLYTNDRWQVLVEVHVVDHQIDKEKPGVWVEWEVG
jgi:Holliday junction resolvase RusA-like endonuclease